jgi:hypothetical protein
LRAAVLVGVVNLLCACAEMPDPLDNLADAGRSFALVHPTMTRAALMGVRAALRKPQQSSLRVRAAMPRRGGRRALSTSAPRLLFINLNQ